MKANALTSQQEEWLAEELKGYDVTCAIISGAHLFGIDVKGDKVYIEVFYTPSIRHILAKKIPGEGRVSDDKLGVSLQMRPITSCVELVRNIDMRFIHLLYAPDDMIIFNSPLWGKIRYLRGECIALDMITMLDGAISGLACSYGWGYQYAHLLGGLYRLLELLKTGTMTFPMDNADEIKLLTRSDERENFPEATALIIATAEKCKELLRKGEITRCAPNHQAFLDALEIHYTNCTCKIGPMPTG